MPKPRLQGVSCMLGFAWIITTKMKRWTLWESAQSSASINLPSLAGLWDVVEFSCWKNEPGAGYQWVRPNSLLAQLYTWSCGWNVTEVSKSLYLPPRGHKLSVQRWWRVGRAPPSVCPSTPHFSDHFGYLWELVCFFSLPMDSQESFCRRPQPRSPKLHCGLLP